MEHLLLGLLMLTPMTGYALQQFIKQNLSLICSHSAGSVQTALSKLEREGHIAAAEELDGKRRKKTFSITPSGKAAFLSWVSQPMQADKVKNMELSRLFFLGFAAPQERANAIRDYLHQIEETLTILRIIQERFTAAQHPALPPGQDWPSIFRFQGYTIDYGIAAAEFELAWYSRLLCELEEKGEHQA